MSGFYRDWLNEYEQRILPLRDSEDDEDLDYDDEYNQHLEGLHEAVADDPYVLDAAPQMLKACEQLIAEFERGREWISEDTLDMAVRAVKQAKGMK